MRSADRSRLHGAAVGRHARGLDVGRGREACCEPRGSTASEDGNVGHDLRVYRILPRSRHDRVSKGLYSVRDSLYPRRPFVQNSPKKRSPGPVDLPQELASETGARSICRSGVTHRMDRAAGSIHAAASRDRRPLPATISEPAQLKANAVCFRAFGKAKANRVCNFCAFSFESKRRLLCHLGKQTNCKRKANQLQSNCKAKAKQSRASFAFRLLFVCFSSFCKTPRFTRF